MGFLVGERCFDTQAQAADQWFSGKEPSYTAGSTSYVSWFEKNVSNVWQINRQSISSTGTITNLTTSNATVPVFPSCTVTDNFNDGMLLGWGVAAAMIGAYAIKFIAKGL